MIQYYVGLDLGQRKDYTAIAVVEREEPTLYHFDYVSWLRRDIHLETRFSVRHLERVALGTSYPAVVERVRQVVSSPELRGKCALVVDGTGVGAAVVDLLRESDMDCELVAVTITGGVRAHGGSGAWNVPKRDLIGVMQVMLEQKRLGIAAGMPGAKMLVNELMGMRVQMASSGNERHGAWREGSHDDLALAVAMACWRAKGDERVVGEMGCGRIV